MTEDLEKYEARQPTVIPPAETGLTPLTPAGLLEIAVSQGADLDKLEKLMDLQERWEKNEAKKAYVVAMTAFKADPPEILKQTQVEYKKIDGTVTKYKHASLDHVAEQVNVALSKHGLFASWPQSQSESGITVTCKITHVMGHYEETSLTAAADLSGNKNAIQGLGSTTAYLQRYTMLAIAGLAAKGMDNDAEGAITESEPITQANIDKIEELKKKAGIDTPEKEIKFQNRLQELYKTPAIDRLNVDEANDLIRALQEGVKFQAKQKEKG